MLIEGMRKGTWVTALVEFINVHFSTPQCPCFLMFASKEEIYEGAKRKGAYKSFFGVNIGMIFVLEGMDIGDTMVVILHEYAHHLSQTSHGYVLYELFLEELRRKVEEDFINYVETRQNRERNL